MPQNICTLLVASIWSWVGDDVCRQTRSWRQPHILSHHTGQGIHAKQCYGLPNTLMDLHLVMVAWNIFSGSSYPLHEEDSSLRCWTYPWMYLFKLSWMWSSVCHLIVALKSQWSRHQEVELALLYRLAHRLEWCWWLELFLGCQESSVPCGHLRQTSCSVHLLVSIEDWSILT